VSKLLWQRLGELQTRPKCNAAIAVSLGY